MSCTFPLNRTLELLGCSYSHASVSVDWRPSGFTTRTSCLPMVPAVVVASIRPVPSTRTALASLLPKKTLTGPDVAKPRPVSVTRVPPALGPRVGVSALSCSGSTYKNAPSRTSWVPSGEVTLSRVSPAPDRLAGATKVSCVPSLATD